MPAAKRSSAATKKRPPLPNCSDCRHFFVTWDPARPYGCRGFAFKTSRRPGEVVFESSGAPCRLFRARNGRKAKR